MLDLFPLHPFLCHPRTGEPLQAVGVVDGKPVWPILGGADDDDDADADKDKDDNADDADDADADKDKDDDGDKDGKKKPPPEEDPSNIEYWKKRSRSNERAARKSARELKALQESQGKGKPSADDGGKKKDDDADGDKQPDREQIRKEIEREVLHERVGDRIEAKATAFADPADAAAILLRDHDWQDFLDSDDKIDVEAIKEALEDLGTKKKHLLAQGKQRFQGGGDGGARQQKPGRPKNLGEALSRRYSGDK